jgi:hypothetical protein
MDALLADLIALVAILFLVVFCGGWKVIAGAFAVTGFIIAAVVGAITFALGFIILAVVTPFKMAYTWLVIRRLSRQGRKRYRNPT